MEILLAIRNFNLLRFELFTIGKYFSLCFFETWGGYSFFSVTVLLTKDFLGFYCNILYKEMYKEFMRNIGETK